MNPDNPLCNCVTLILISFLISGCGGEQTKSDESVYFPWIRDSQHLVLYEGLPHPGMETKLFKREMERHDTVSFNDYMFYVTPLEVSALDKDRLKSVLENNGSIEDWKGEKACGGFHPDYLAEWRAGNATYRVMVCFGCHEVKVFGPGVSERYDMSMEGIQQLEKLLKLRKKNRPEAEYG